MTRPSSPAKNHYICLAIAAAVLISTLLPVYFLTKSFGWWQKEFVARGYAVGVQIHQNIYELNLFDLAFTKPAFDQKSVYVPATHLNSYVTLLALARQSFPTSKNILLATENPYFSGRISIPALNANRSEWLRDTLHYRSAGGAYQVTRLIAPPDNTILSYSNSADAPEELHESPYLKEIINQGMCRSDGHSTGCGIAEDTYINVSAIMRDYFGADLRYQIDEENKRIILQFTPMPDRVP